MVTPKVWCNFWQRKFPSRHNWSRWSHSVVKGDSSQHMTLAQSFTVRASWSLENWRRFCLLNALRKGFWARTRLDNMASVNIRWICWNKAAISRLSGTLQPDWNGSPATASASIWFLPTFVVPERLRHGAFSIPPIFLHVSRILFKVFNERFVTADIVF